jgi:hypothetical protein
MFLFKCYWYDTTNREIRVDSHHGLVEINSKTRLRNVNDVFVFAKQYQQVYYTYTPFFRKDYSRVDWLFILKVKPNDHVEVIQNKNNKSNMRNDVFQVNKLVNLYRVVLSIFYIFDNIFVHDAGELKAGEVHSHIFMLFLLYM